MARVSIVLPVYNAEKYLDEALNSLYRQTYGSFEVIIIDDCSSDASAKIIDKHLNIDRRVKVLRHDKNLGLTDALNNGFKNARGEFIAIMNADDICLPTRIEKQVQFLEKNLNIDIVGTACIFFGASPKKINSYPLDDDIIKATLLFSSCFCHPSVMIRKSSFVKHNLQYEKPQPIEDLDLWIRASRHLKFANLAEPLLRYRIHSTQISFEKAEEQLKQSNQLRKEQLNYWGIHLSAKNERVFDHIVAESLDCIDLFKDIPDFIEDLETQFSERFFKKGTLKKAIKKTLTVQYYKNFFDRKIKKFLINEGLVELSSLDVVAKFFLIKGGFKKSIKRILVCLNIVNSKS